MLTDTTAPERIYDKQVPRPAKSAARAAQIQVQNRRQEYLRRHPSYFEVLDRELADPILYERLIKRHQTSQERQEEGVTKGYARILEADLARGETRLSALATEAAGEQRTEFTATAKWKPRLDIDHAWNEEATSKEQGRELWKGYLTERFVQGGDEDFEYSAVDGDEELDGEERQAEVDKWFDDEEEGWDNGEKTGETGIQDF